MIAEEKVVGKVTAMSFTGSGRVDETEFCLWCGRQVSGRVRIQGRGIRGFCKYVTLDREKYGQCQIMEMPLVKSRRYHHIDKV